MKKSHEMLPQISRKGFCWNFFDFMAPAGIYFKSLQNRDNLVLHKDAMIKNRTNYLKHMVNIKAVFRTAMLLHVEGCSVMAECLLGFQTIFVSY